MTEWNETEENETKETQKTKTTRDLYTAYICARCDTDFGINDMGCMLKIGIYAMECPICHHGEFHVYHIVDENNPRPPRPPLVKDLRQQLDEENETDNEW